MSEPTLQAQRDAARAYESLFVPAIFGPWAPKVVDAARIGPGQRVLDVACGTGILVREIVSRTGSTVGLAGLDRSPGMIAVAKELTPAVDWREGCAEALPFPDASFDAVVSQFGLMFFPDRLRALREMQRVLSPGCRLAVAVWNSLEHIPAYATMVEILQRRAGQPAADALRAPFVLGNRDDLSTLFRDAGAESLEITTEHAQAHFPAIRTIVEAELRGWLPLTGVFLDEDQIAGTLQDAEHALRSYATRDGRAVLPMSAHIVMAKKPASAARR